MMLLFLLLMMRMKCSGMVSKVKRARYVGKLFPEDIPRSFFFFFGSSQFHPSGAGRSGAGRGAGPIVVTFSKSLDNNNLFCRIGREFARYSTTFFLPTLHTVDRPIVYCL